MRAVDRKNPCNDSEYDELKEKLHNTILRDQVRGDIEADIEPKEM